MKRLLWFSAAMAALINSAFADNWMFRPSYFTGLPPQPGIGRQYSTAPFYTVPRGEFVHVGFRTSISNIVVGNQVFDTNRRFESYIQYGEQF